jgi:hypothetical protein
MWATFVVFKKLFKLNNHPMGEYFAQSGHTGCDAPRQRTSFETIYFGAKKMAKLK